MVLERAQKPVALCRNHFEIAPRNTYTLSKTSQQGFEYFRRFLSDRLIIRKYKLTLPHDTAHG
jgi:hypothetical protein